MIWWIGKENEFYRPDVEVEYMTSVHIPLARARRPEEQRTQLLETTSDFCCIHRSAEEKESKKNQPKRMQNKI